ncbi:MAG: hypothetical protein VB031_02130 [Eubacteriaceae bacterium]|nr:hypothetical protein [Eubacteriaceae bacterium]
MSNTAGSNVRGIHRLARVMDRRMIATTDGAPVLELGVITSNFALKTDGFGEAIGASEYSICRSLTIGKTGSKLTETADGTNVKVPESMCKVKKGDRVLVAWIDGEAVVIDIIVDASEVK